MRAAWALILILLPAAGCLEDGGTPPAGAPTAASPTPLTPTPPTAAPAGAAAMRTLAEGDQSGVEGDVRRLITDDATWRAFWDEHGSRQLPPPEMPAVDFSQERVLAVVLADKPSSGYSVRVVNVTIEGNETVVEVVTSRPPPDVGTASVITQPFHFVAIPVGPAQLRFLEREAVGAPPG